MVAETYAKNFDDADEVFEIEHLRSENLTLGGLTVSHDVHQPGWRWSTHVKPVVGTEWCMVRHVGVVLQGRIGIRLEDGTEFECRPWDVVDIPPRHDGWVIGDEPCELLSWIGVRGWLEPLASLKERVLTTIAFTDIVDSTGTAARLGPSAWGELVATHEARVRETLSRFLGREIRMTGDGVLAIFDGAARAVRCVHALLEVGRDLGLGVRGSVHTGEVEITDEDLRGIAVHEAARMLGLAGDGEVLVSATTAALIGDAGFRFEDRGDHSFKGIDGPRRVFRVE
jgi:class 3 adenylate cyclase